jgi:hypothetical protein
MMDLGVWNPYCSVKRGWVEKELQNVLAYIVY